MFLTGTDAFFETSYEDPRAAFQVDAPTRCPSVVGGSSAVPRSGSVVASTAVPSGWFADPGTPRSAELRWWDGTHWCNWWWREGHAVNTPTPPSTARSIAPAAKRVPSPPAPPTSTKTSQAVGNAARTFVSWYQKIPVVSAPADLIRAKNGLEGLVDAVKTRPDDPEPYLWLGDAIAKAMRDGKTYMWARAIVEPMALVEGTAIRAATRLGLEDPPDVSLKKSAFALCVRRLQENTRDTTALYVASRIYLTRDSPSQALRFAHLARITDPNNAQPLVVMAMTYLRVQDHQSAGAFAWQSIDGGCTVGYQVLSHLVLGGYLDARVLSTTGYRTSGARPQLSLIDRASASYDLRHGVTPEDWDSYYGPHPHGSAILDSVVHAQIGKVRTITDHLGHH